VAPWWAHPAASAASSPANANILLERHTDHDLMARDTDDLTTRLPDIGNMFENFCAEYAIESVVGKVELRHVSGNGDNARIIKRRLLHVKRGYRSEMPHK